MLLESKRILIREFKPQDFNEVFAYMSDPDTTYFLGDGLLDEDGTRKLLVDGKAFAIVLRDTQEVVGHIEFFDWFGGHTYELGWAIAPKFLKQGLATEAAALVVVHAFENLKLHRLIATCQPENPASYKLMEKIGMVREGYFRKCIPRPNNEWWDEYFYSMIQEDYEASCSRLKSVIA